MNLFHQSNFTKIYNFINYRLHSLSKKIFYGIKEKNAKTKGIIVYKHPLGFNIKLNLSRIVDREIQMGFFETDTLEFFKKVLKPDMVFFDVGANIGLFSLIAKQKQKSIKVYAFEPADEVYQDFLENVKINQFDNVNIYKKGVSDITGQISFNICEDNAYNSIHSNPMVDIVKTVTIDTFSIDDFCQQNGIEKIDVMKIDTEGAELLVLKGGERMFSQNNAPILFMEYNRYILDEKQLEDIYEVLKKYGYYVYELHQGNIRKFDLSKSKSFDLICVKKNHLT